MLRHKPDTGAVLYAGILPEHTATLTAAMRVRSRDQAQTSAGHEEWRRRRLLVPYVLVLALPVQWPAPVQVLLSRKPAVRQTPAHLAGSIRLKDPHDIALLP